MPIINPGLWDIAFGNGGRARSPDILYFSAGIHAEMDGLFGDIAPVPDRALWPSSASACSA